MSKNQNKTISCNSNGIIISYGDANKHQFVNYGQQLPNYVRKIQLHSTVKYQNIEEKTKLNFKQKDLYSKVVYGFKAYTKEELQQMPERARQNVIITYSKAQRLLRNWKQDLTYSFVDKLMLTLFPKSSIARQMSEVSGHLDDVSEKDEIPFIDLGINQDAIINKLIEFDLLPKNFYQLV
jgi:hypothetical protein